MQEVWDVKERTRPQGRHLRGRPSQCCANKGLFQVLLFTLFGIFFFLNSTPLSRTADEEVESFGTKIVTCSRPCRETSEKWLTEDNGSINNVMLYQRYETVQLVTEIVSLHVELDLP